ncbi:PAS domain S-box protein [Phytohalomonas tamaricis]|uniref:PAS domain S-box protein n=1 Tax=Phytohalomonas tamaricis TaxID=2081032 RepID=UPI0021D43C17|nr:PAS domain S-box protein [Phytohalomonas tamaricis]
MIHNEIERIKLLHALNLLDTEAEPVFDRITRLLAKTLNLPIALITLVDSQRQWFKSKVGLSITETSIEDSFCAHAVARNSPLIVNDAVKDARFKTNPLVTDEPFIRFYAGIPIRTIEGYPVGTLCAIDTQPRQLTNDERETLSDLAGLVTHEIQRRETALLSRSYIESSDAQIKANEARVHNVFMNAGVGIALISAVGKWLDVNDALCEMLGYSRTEMEHSDLNFQDITASDDLENSLRLMQQLIDGRIDKYRLEKRYLKKDGDYLWVNMSVTKQLSPKRKIDYFVAIIEDIHARKEAEESLAILRVELEERVAERTKKLSRANEMLSTSMIQQVRSESALRKREAELSAVLENANDAYISLDKTGIINAWNRAAEETFGWTRHEALGEHVDTLIIPPEMRQAHREGMKRFIDSGITKVVGQRLEVSALHKDGSSIPIELRISAIDIDGEKVFSAFLHDISERKLVAEKREKEALQDALTGLPNRRALYELLPRAMARVKRSRKSLGLLFLDLNGFKAVNDTYGHEAGDIILKEVASRLRDAVRETDAVFRLAGDEFTIVLEGLTSDVADSKRLAKELLQVISKPLITKSFTAHVSTSIGIALHSVNGIQTAQQIIKSADSAMYEAKRAGKGIVISSS